MKILVARKGEDGVWHKCFIFRANKSGRGALTHKWVQSAPINELAGYFARQAGLFFAEETAAEEIFATLLGREFRATRVYGGRG